MLSIYASRFGAEHLPVLSWSSNCSYRYLVCTK